MTCQALTKDSELCFTENMNAQIVAVIIQNAGVLLTEFVKTRPRKSLAIPTEAEPFVESPPIPTETYKTQPSTTETHETKATDIATGCVPCSIGHLGACTGILNEATRFAFGEEGISSNEVVDRTGMCLDELNVMERVDLRPEMIADLPEWEKALAMEALKESRQTRHALESLSSAEQLEQIAANTQRVRKKINRSWMKYRLSHLTPAEKEKVEEQMKTRLKELTEGGLDV